MKNRIRVHKAVSFKEAERFNDKYYLAMTPEERLSIVQLCREEYYAKIRHEGRKRFRRVVTIVRFKAAAGRKIDEADLEKLLPLRKKRGK